MSRSASKHGTLFVWNDNDDPGAGSKLTSVSEGNTGLNGVINQIEDYLYPEHNINGTHRNDVIHGANINADAVDDVTIEVSAATGTKVIQLKVVPLAYIDTTGATDGEVLMYSGGNLIFGSYTPADLSISRAMLEDFIKPVTSQTLFGDNRVAGIAVSDTVAAETEWSENSVAGVVKIEGFFKRRPEDQFIRVHGRALTNNGARAWFVELLLDGVVVATATGTNTAYGDMEVDISEQISTGIAIPAGPVGHRVKWQVQLRATSPATAKMTQIIVSISGTDTDV